MLAFIMTLAACLTLKSMPVATSPGTGAQQQQFPESLVADGKLVVTRHSQMYHFDTFGEGSFDKAIYVSIPIDWIISSPNRTKRRLMLRPITRDGGAQLSSARRLYREIENFKMRAFKREIGRLWK